MARTVTLHRFAIPAIPRQEVKAEERHMVVIDARTDLVQMGRRARPDTVQDFIA
jgi:hypothetical protein